MTLKLKLYRHSKIMGLQGMEYFVFVDYLFIYLETENEYSNPAYST